MSTTAHAPIPATLIPGDGIGPEITEATLRALDALGAKFEWDRQVAGMAGVTAHGDPLPQACVESIRRTRLALKGPLETPVAGGYRFLPSRVWGPPWERPACCSCHRCAVTWTSAMQRRHPSSAWNAWSCGVRSSWRS